MRTISEQLHDGATTKRGADCLIMKAADHIDAQAAKIKALVKALNGVMIGGNHLATWLPIDHAPFEADPLTVLEQMGAGMEYDIWCCWRSIMQARPVLAVAKESP